MKKSTSLILTGLFILFATNSFAIKMRANMLFSAKMDGAQETPSVSVTGTGVGSLMLNATKDTLCINITFSGLTGTPTGAHIHGGPVGVAGGVLVDLTSNIIGNRLVATITGTALSASLKSEMLKGMTYLNIHTAAYPNGEIRGQISLESDKAFTGWLDGAQETPSVTTSANGYAVFNVSQHQGRVKFYVVTNGLSGSIVSAHIHNGAPGVAGPIIQDLTSYINGDVLTGVFTPSANVIATLMAGNGYINIHTNANPGGEIRAQLRMDDKIAFDAWLDGAQETPSVSTAAKGLASLKLNTTMDSLWYSVYVTSGFSSTITMAHIHNGAVGIAGGVAAPLTMVSANQFTGTITGTVLNTTLINDMLMGLTYVNVHTTTYPAGEIRGQIWRVMREGYTTSMEGSNEVPPVATSAKGSGMVSIDRDMDNAHYMFVTNGITPIGFHFHKAAVGVNGPVINDLTSVFSMSCAFGYWKTTDTSPFSPFSAVIANTIDADSVYVNAHTTANPNGEIRGQIWSGFRCFSISTGINSANTNYENEVTLFPNPANGYFNISLYSALETKIYVKVFNVVGGKVYDSTNDIHSGNNNLSIDMKGTSAGVYFVKISDGKKESVTKLILD